MSQNSEESKKPGIFSKIEEDMISSTVESIMPKILPLIEPIVKKVETFLGDNENFIILRKMPGKSATVIVLNNKGGDYFIKSENGDKSFSADPEAINGVHEVNTFIKALISGDLKME